MRLGLPLLSAGMVTSNMDSVNYSAEIDVIPNKAWIRLSQREWEEEPTLSISHDHLMMNSRIFGFEGGEEGE